MHFRPLLSLLIFILLLTFTQGQTLEKVPCFLENCKSVNKDKKVEFGYLTVPENWNKPDARQLRLAFAVLHSTEETPATDPVLYLSGGPGTKALDGIKKWQDHPLRAERDIILMDFRGIGYSEPLMCPDLNQTIWEVFAANLDATQEALVKLAFFTSCFEELQQQGLDLNQYNAATVVKDLEALRTQLGYETWNILGISYGTRMAQTYMRDAPDHLRAVILDSPVPVGTPLDTPYNGYEKALEIFFYWCENDSACNQRFPELKQQFFKAMDRLKWEPIVLYSSRKIDSVFYVNYQDAHLMFFQFLKDKSNYAALPWLIETIQNRQTESLYNMISMAKSQNDRVSPAFGALTHKYDSYYLPRKNGPSKTHPLYNALVYFDGESMVLDNMNFISSDTIERNPIESPIPTLILSGSIDPITPVKYGKVVHTKLNNSYLLEFPGIGHGVSRSGACVEAIMQQFIDHPTSKPERACVGDLGTKPVSFFTDLYQNAKIGTLIRQLFIEKQRPLLFGLTLFVLSWLGSISSFWKSKSQDQGGLTTIYRLTSRLTATLGIILLLGLGLFVVNMASQNQMMVLFGLDQSAKSLCYISYFILLGSVLSFILLVRAWTGFPKSTGKLFEVVFMLSLLCLCLIISMYALFPNLSL